MAPVLPHLDLAELQRLLMRIESDAHRTGWVTHGAGLHVFVLYDGADVVTAAQLHRTMGGMGRPVRVGGRYCAQLMLPARLFDRANRDSGRPPWEYLRNFVLNIAYGQDSDVPPERSRIPPGSLDMMRALVAMPGIFGFAACYEAWYAPVKGPVTAKTQLKNEPGARECRVVLAVDALDRVHRVQRLRGDRPQADMDAPIRGDLSTSLRILVDTAYGRLPAANEEAFTARYPTLNESMQNGRDAGQRSA